MPARLGRSQVRCVPVLLRRRDRSPPRSGPEKLPGVPGTIVLVCPVVAPRMEAQGGQGHRGAGDAARLQGKSPPACRRAALKPRTVAVQRSATLHAGGWTGIGQSATARHFRPMAAGDRKLLGLLDGLGRAVHAAGSSRIRSTRSPCSPVAASTQLPILPRSVSNRTAHKDCGLAHRPTSPTIQYRPSRRPAGQVMAANGLRIVWASRSESSPARAESVPMSRCLPVDRFGVRVDGGRTAVRALRLPVGWCRRARTSRSFQLMISENSPIAFEPVDRSWGPKPGEFDPVDLGSQRLTGAVAVHRSRSDCTVWPFA
jgi:hypothetical protein